jgi:hypothetical protein
MFMARKGQVGPLCQVPQGRGAKQYKWQVCEDPAQPLPASQVNCWVTVRADPKMKTLLLVFGLGLFAALQLQALPIVEEDQDVRIRWAGGLQGRGAETAGRRLHSSPLSKETLTLRQPLNPCPEGC